MITNSDEDCDGKIEGMRKDKGTSFRSNQEDCPIRNNVLIKI